MLKQLIVIGDKVLIEPDVKETKTDAGLYLPQNVKDRDKVNAGRIVKAGPGYPVFDPGLLDQDPWVKTSKTKYFPLQVKEGDYCIYLKEQAVEIKFEKKKYVVVSHSAILVLVREGELEEGGLSV